jgi:hypothetical protein
MLLIRFYWLDACIGRFPPALAKNLHNPPAIGKQGMISEEMSQTLVANIVKPTKSRINREKYTFCVKISFFCATKKI